jgi:rare lipoprotein A (peptidoglycan hydrolase)
VVLPTQMMRYQKAAEAAAATTPTTTAPVTPTTVTPSTTPTTTATPKLTPSVEQAPVTTTTVAPRVTPVTAPKPTTSNSESGQATWYGAAPPGMCASPTLPFGTVLTVTNVATGASTTCTVDDREEAGYPRVVDMSPSGFAQLASTSQGVADVTISW